MIGRLKAALGLKRQSSPEISSLAARVLRMPPKPNAHDGSAQLMDEYNALLAMAKRLAGSALSQDETK